MPDPSKDMPITEAALRLGVSRETAIRMLQRGLVSGGKLFGRYFVTLASLERYESEIEAERKAAIAAQAEAV